MSDLDRKFPQGSRFLVLTLICNLCEIYVQGSNTGNMPDTLDHGPIQTLKWPAMKMEFTAAPSVDLSKVKVGDKVNFTLNGSGGSYTLQSLSVLR
jgi:hypothetical protein